MQPLLNNQQSAKDKIVPMKVGALFMEAGTGKTRVACELVNAIDDVDLVVWVGPLQTIKRDDGVIPEIEKWGGFKCQNVIYIGIETLQASDREYLKLYRKIETSWKCFIVVDESLKIKNHTAKRTQRLITLGQMVEYKLILNGTPITRNLLDLYSQMEFLSSKILKMSLPEFKNVFCEYTTIKKSIGNRTYTKEFITGYENIDYLYSLIKDFVFECNLELQIKQFYNEINYIIEDNVKEEYYRLKEKYLDNEKLLAMNNNIFLEMTQKMQHLYSCAEGKFEALDNHFKEYPEDKHIIFCKYIDSREACHKRYPKAMVLSYQKETFGLNLQHLPYTIFFDKHWDYALRHQGSRRNFRTGQEYDCRYWDFTGDVGLEKLINENINKKISMTEYFKGITKENVKEIISSI